MYVLHYAPDNASLILRLALEEISAPYRTVLVDRSTDAQNSPAYRAFNPNGLIPALETPHGVMFETGACLLWLADTHGFLAPRPDVPARADFLKWLVFCANTLHPSLQTLFYPHKYAGSDAAAQRAVLVQTKLNVARHLQVLDTHWTPPDNPDAITLYVAACLRWLAIYGPEDRAWFSLADTPNLHAMLHRLEPRPSVRHAVEVEGLGPSPFTAPQRPNPPEGSAL